MPPNNKKNAGYKTKKSNAFELKPYTQEEKKKLVINHGMELATKMNKERNKKIEEYEASLPNPNIVGPSTFETIYDFFSIKQGMRRYLTNAIHDASGLYSLLNWKSDNKMNTTANNKIKTLHTGDVVSPRHPELTLVKNNNVTKKAHLNIDVINNSKINDVTDNDNKYVYIGTFSEISNPIQNLYVRILCKIFKHTITNNVLVLFIWGNRINLESEPYTPILNRLYNYILHTLTTQISVNNILLYGFSMGGNLAQHVGILFMEDQTNEFKDSIYICSISAGGTMTNATRFNELLKGRFISIALSRINNRNPENNYSALPKFFKSRIAHPKILQNINSFILPDSNNETVKTLILNIKFIMNADWSEMKMEADSAFSYDSVKECWDDFTQKNIKCLFQLYYENDLHNFRYYHEYIHMLATHNYVTV